MDPLETTTSRRRVLRLWALRDIVLHFISREYLTTVRAYYLFPRILERSQRLRSHLPPLLFRQRQRDRYSTEVSMDKNLKTRLTLFSTRSFRRSLFRRQASPRHGVVLTIGG